MAISYSKSQSATYTADGLALDISPILYQISPEDTPFLTGMKKLEDATATSFDWFQDELQPPAENAHFEEETYTADKAKGIKRDRNWIQHFQKSAQVTDTMQRVKKQYNEKDEMARQMRIAMTQMSQDIERAIVHNDMAKAEVAGITPALMGGIPYFLNEETIAVSFDSSTNKVTCASEHHLFNGSFVLFKAGDATSDVLPTNIESNTIYYVHLDDTDPTKTFTLHKSMNDAVMNVNPIELGSAGTGNLFALLNNNVDANDQPFTENDINDACELANLRGGRPTVAYMSGKSKRRWNSIMHDVNDVERQQGNRKVENVVSVYESDFGPIKAVTHRFYSNDTIHLLDMRYFGLKWFERPHVTELPKISTSTRKVIEGALGLQASQPLASARIHNIKC